MSSGSVWIGIDLGTQSVRVMAVDETGSVLAMSSQPLTARRSGREHTQNPDEWWSAVCTCCKQVMSRVAAERVGGLAVDATSGTILLIDQHLRPVSEALMYDDGRAQDEAREVQVQPTWALPKVLWLWRRTQSRDREVRLAHQNDFINWRLAGTPLATDSSHSLKTGYKLQEDRWPFDTFRKVGLPEPLFPEVVAPGSILGTVSAGAAAETGLPAGLPIIAGMTDGCAAQIAAGAVCEGNWNSVLGTTLVLKGVTGRLLHDPRGAVYSHLAPNGKWLPGGASSTGAGIIAKRFAKEHLEQLEAEAGERGPAEVVVYPLHSTGERFPFVAPLAEYFELGTPRDTVELYRAILEGVAFIERLCFDYMKMLGASLAGTFSISGGAVNNQLWNRIRASVLGRTLTIPKVTEPAFGMAVLASSVTSSLEEAVSRMVSPGATVEPAFGFQANYSERYERLLRELERRGWLPGALASYSLEQAGTA
ncbi:MAG TPA: FGGY family carbohydrate kinase [Bryobacteraceae bacterium]|nr:FGGY family carbohydrate kinase [Bryobacteraceae bacterium]